MHKASLLCLFLVGCGPSIAEFSTERMNATAPPLSVAPLPISLAPLCPESDANKGNCFPAGKAWWAPAKWAVNNFTPQDQDNEVASLLNEYLFSSVSDAGLSPAKCATGITIDITRRMLASPLETQWGQVTTNVESTILDQAQADFEALVKAKVPKASASISVKYRANLKQKLASVGAKSGSARYYRVAIGGDLETAIRNAGAGANFAPCSGKRLITGMSALFFKNVSMTSNDFSSTDAESAFEAAIAGEAEFTPQVSASLKAEVATSYVSHFSRTVSIGASLKLFVVPLNIQVQQAPTGRLGE